MGARNIYKDIVERYGCAAVAWDYISARLTEDARMIWDNMSGRMT
jgi:hypothetical protein